MGGGDRQAPLPIHSNTRGHGGSVRSTVASRQEGLVQAERHRSGFQSVKQFTSELIVEAVVRCVRVINMGGGLSLLLPPGMSARFRVGMGLAQACQVRGLRLVIGDIWLDTGFSDTWNWSQYGCF